MTKSGKHDNLNAGFPKRLNTLSTLSSWPHILKLSTKMYTRSWPIILDYQCLLHFLTTRAGNGTDYNFYLTQYLGTRILCEDGDDYSKNYKTASIP